MNTNIFDVELDDKRIIGTKYGYCINYFEDDYKLFYRLSDEETFLGDVFAFCWWDKNFHNEPSFKQNKGSTARYNYYKEKLTDLTGMDFVSLNAKAILE